MEVLKSYSFFLIDTYLHSKLFFISFFKEEDHKTYTLLRGHFLSPLAIHLPGVVPKSSEQAHFEVLLPKQWKWANNMKPMVIQFAGTGDHVAY